MIDQKFLLVLNIILFIFIIKIYMKLNKEDFADEGLTKEQKEIELKDKLGAKIDDVFIRYFKVDFGPLRKLDYIFNQIKKGYLNSNIRISGGLQVMQNLSMDGKTKIMKNVNIDKSLTGRNGNFKDMVNISNDIKVNRNVFFNGVSAKYNYNYLY